MTNQLQSILNDETLLLLRYIIVGLNALMGVLAIVLGISGLSVHPNEINYINLMSRSVLTSPYWLVPTGVLLLTAAGVSFYCAYTEALYGILGYLVLMAVIFVIEIVFGIALRHESKAGFQKKMEDNMSKYISDFAPWDKIQRELFNIAFVTVWVYMLRKKDNVGPYWSSNPVPAPS